MPSLNDRFLSSVASANQEEAELFYSKFVSYIQYVSVPPSESFRIDTMDVYGLLGCESPAELNALVTTHLQQGRYKLAYRGSRTRLSPSSLVELCERLNTPPSRRVVWYFRKLIQAFGEMIQEEL